VAADGIVVETGGLATAWTDGGASPTAPETAAAPTPAKAEVCVDADAGGACDEAAWIGRVCEDPDATSDAGGIGARTEARFSLAPPNGGVELGTVCPSVVDANVWGEEVWGVGGAAASASAVGDGDDPLVCGKAEVCAVEIWGEAGCAEGICAVDGDDGIGLETAGGAASETAVVRGAGAGVSWA
jgi:hypothetical protein